MSLRLGRFELHEIRAGRFALDGGAMFGVVPKALWEKLHPADERNRIWLALRCLLVREGTRTLMVDTGIGHGFGPKQAAQLAINLQEPNLESELARAGVTPDEVTDVVLTHLHFDHGGGTTRGAGTELTFPNAVHHLQRRHWEWARRPSERDAGSFKPEVLVALEGSGKLNLLDGPGELYPGIHLWISEGHTVAMQCVEIRDGEQSLLYCADLVPTLAHLRPVWHMAYDLFPLTVVAEKKALLAEAARKHSTLFFEHDPGLSACTIKEDRDSFVLDQVVPL